MAPLSLEWTSKGMSGRAGGSVKRIETVVWSALLFTILLIIQAGGPADRLLLKVFFK